MSISIWEQQSFYAKCDVLIVGAGLLGLWTARELKIKYPQLKVTLIDKNSLPQGASTRNAGFACMGSPTEMLHDIKLMGEQAMWQVVEQRWKGIQKIFAVLGQQKIGFDACGGYECLSADQPTEWEEVETNLEYLNRGLRNICGAGAGFEAKTDRLTALGLAGFTHLVQHKLEGGLHSGMLVENLSALVREMGVRILYQLPFLAMEPNANGYTVLAGKEQPVKLQAQQIIFATNGFLSKQFPQLGIVPARGQMLLSPPIQSLPLTGTFHSHQGYYYFRNLGTQVLIGGARHLAFAEEETVEMETTETIQTALFDYLQKHVPAVKGIPQNAYTSWSGIMAMHTLKQPVLEQVAHNAWAAMSCNGMGVALTPVFAEKIVEKVRGFFVVIFFAACAING